MATISETFSSARVGRSMLLRHSEIVNYEATTGGFTGTIRLEESRDGGQTWAEILAATGAVSAGAKKNTDMASRDLLVRWRCLAASAGSIVCTIVEQAEPVQGSQIYDQDGNLVFEATEGGVRFPLTATVEGAFSASGGVSLGAALTALSGLTPAADKVPYFSSGSAASLADSQAYGRSILNTSNKLALQTLGGLAVDPGRMAVNVLRIAANVADTETVTIGADVYEFDTDSTVTPGNIPVDVSGSVLPADATDALIAAINTSGTEDVTAVDISDNEILLHGDTVGDVTLACAETMAGVNNEWAAAAMFGGADQTTRRCSVQRRVPTATEVALGQMHFMFDFTPAFVQALVAPTATPGALAAWDGGVTISGGRMTVDNAGAVDWAVTDDVVVLAWA